MESKWIITENSFSPAEIPKFETLFSLGNGYLGIRGVLDEHTPMYKPGTFINGFYETEPIVYGERAYGYPELRQQMVPLTEASKIRLFIGTCPLDLETGKVGAYNRRLDMRRGILVREISWESPQGKRADIRFERLVSFKRPYIAAFRVTVLAVHTDMHVGIESKLAEHKQNPSDSLDPRVGETLKKKPLLMEQNRFLEDGTGLVRCHTRSSGLSYICTMRNALSSNATCTESRRKTGNGLAHRFDLQAPKNSEIILEKTVCYTSSVDLEPDKMDELNREELNRAAEDGFETLAEEQRKYLHAYWKNGDVEIVPDGELQKSVRFNIFHLQQAAGNNGSTGIPAKGLTGEGYEGHYFWDTEIYMLPLFLYTKPETAKQLLLYRYNTLPQARERARTLHYKGALFPWRTINGNEASAYFPAGTAQYHINADIAYTVKKYISITGDYRFLAEHGAEIVFETARFWADFTDYIPGKGYCFNEVTGPDEYTACVTNNSYTNYMVLAHLEYAAATAEFLQKTKPLEYSRLVKKIGLMEKEIDGWRRISAEIYLPERRKDGVLPQDDTFLDKGKWDFDSVPKENYPLLLYYHPLNIYRYQVLKQPDVVLAMFLLGDRFSREEKSVNFNYYDPLTTGDSSLSFCIQSIMAAEIGDMRKAYGYFIKSARMDIADINKNVKDGIHAAAMGGTWLSLIYGFAGLRDYGNCLSFDPRLPADWKCLSFTLLYRKRVLKITMQPETAVYTLISGETVEIMHAGKRFRLEPGEERRFSLKKNTDSLDIGI